MAIAWVLRDPRMTSALIGASRVEQIREIAGALKNTAFSKEELQAIDRHARGERAQPLEAVEHGLASRFIAWRRRPGFGRP